MDPFMSARSAHNLERIEGESLLPSCDDLIAGVQPKPDTGYASYPCTTCWTQDGRTSRPDSPCLACTSINPFAHRNSTAAPPPYPPAHPLAFPCRASTTNIPSPALPSPPYYRPARHSPPPASSAFFAASYAPAYPPHGAPTQYAQHPVSVDAPPPALSASKQATNDRPNHNLIEKHRRDANGAFVQVAELLRAGIDIGALADCAVCLAAGSTSPSSPLPCTAPTSSASSWSPTLPSPHDVPAPAPPLSAHKTKTLKNDKVHASLMFHFAFLLHHTPALLGARLCAVRAYAAELGWEKAQWMAVVTAGVTTEAVRRKWRDDCRAEVVGEALRVMEGLAVRHGFGDVVAEGQGGKRKREDGVREYLYYKGAW